jgi:hypothetical protein
MHESNDMQGILTLRLTDRDGHIINQIQHKNRIVSSGRNLVARLFSGRLEGTPLSNVTHMGVGTGNTPPADGDTALANERSPRQPISDVRHSFYTQADGVNRARVQLVSIFDFNDANGAEPLREAGIFTADSGGQLYSRVVFDDVTKTNAFRLTLLWDIDF